MRLYAPLRTTSLDPYQILALSRSADSKQIKQAYYALVKRHHPDRPSSSKPKDFEFKDIVAAYELLSDERKRRQYLNYGMGWGSRPTSATQDYGFNFDNMHNPWKPRDGRRHRHAHERPRYPSTAWDYGHSESTEFYSSNRTYWQDRDREGNYTSNAAFIGILASLSAVLYSVQFWRLAPPLPGTTNASSFDSLVAGDPKDAPIYRQSSMMKGRDKHHDDASRALGSARENAQKYGLARREGIRRRVRASNLEAIESGLLGTGHNMTEEDLFRNSVDEEPHKYVRQQVDPSQRTIKRGRRIQERPDNAQAVRPALFEEPERRAQSRTEPE